VSARILIVDDEAPLRRTLERALKGMGCEVVSAGDAHVAYQLLDETDVDLVLLDLHLPQMSGATFYLALTRRWPRLADRIVLMTGDSFPEMEHWPADLRRCPLLLKPFTLELLRNVVLAALEGPTREGRTRNGHA
jgi:DNA-binding NtrC family response regulator